MWIKIILAILSAVWLIAHIIELTLQKLETEWRNAKRR
jgi:hypothetical protein